jgi:dTDP-4-dehydrorhamnose 3,5-epimerase
MIRRFIFKECSLSGLYTIRRIPIEDSRGFFARFFCAEEFKDIGLDQSIAQINHTLTVQKGTIRGLHYQHPPHCEIKIVNCLRGHVFDVVVDIRQDSPTFLKWHGEVLSEKNMKGLYIPQGFAHGFQALSKNCVLLYLHSSIYTASDEGGLNVIDPVLDISWPLPFADCSFRDKNIPMIDNSFLGVAL